jgi:hypothetical protein
MTVPYKAGTDSKNYIFGKKVARAVSVCVNVNIKPFRSFSKFLPLNTLRSLLWKPSGWLAPLDVRGQLMSQMLTHWFAADVKVNYLQVCVCSTHAAASCYSGSCFTVARGIDVHPLKEMYVLVDASVVMP